MSEPKNPKAGGLWARLFGVNETDEEAQGSPPSREEPPPSAEPVSPSVAVEAAPPAPEAETAPVAEANGESKPTEEPVAVSVTETIVVETVVSAESLPALIEIPPPVTEPPVFDEVPLAPIEAPLESQEPTPAEPVTPAESVVAEEVTPAAAVTLAEIVLVLPTEAPAVATTPAVVEEPPVKKLDVPQVCQACGTKRKDNLSYCEDCGWMFPAQGDSASYVDSSPSPRESDMPASSSLPLRNRFEIGGLILERQDVRRHRGIDLTTGQTVVIVAAPLAEAALPLAQLAPVAVVSEDEIMPGFDDDIPVASPVILDAAAWPSIAWEKSVIEKANHPALPKVLDYITDDTTEYLVLEVPTGTSLWDAWDDPEATSNVRYGWLQKIAAGLEALHKAGAIYEGVRPDVLVLADNGQPRFADITDVLPLPLPANAPIRASLYTAPELILSPRSADARSDLYSFGALLYSLEYLHHPLEKKDFEREFAPLQITERFPDVHPLFLRLINKTFCRDINMRFPSDEMTKKDPSGFNELIRSLEVCRRTFDKVRLDISAWTTTGMVRTGNEDALSVLHGVDARLDDLHEYTMVLLCDGMGGYEAGEIAADLAINEMRKFLLQQPIFSALAGKPAPKDPVDPKKYQDVLKEALKHANREVFSASRVPGKGRRGMGCTAECVYIDSHYVIAGHIGDSRVYHLHQGRLIQLTKDQTLVQRLADLGQLTPEEAENHPRKNELQQAIGGQPDVMPGLYHGKLLRGDWVLVCSDGLTNHISNAELEKMLTREAANSAEEAARRLLNLVNLRGATDNATIVVVRAS